MPNNRDYTVKMPGDGRWYTSSNPSGTTVRSDYLWAGRTATSNKRRKPMGRWIGPTGYSMSEYARQDPVGSWEWTNGPTNKQRETGVLPFHSSAQALFLEGLRVAGVPDVAPAELSNRALINARNNAKGNSIDLGVAFAERRETAGFVGDTLGSIAKLGLAIIRGDKKAVVNTVEKYLYKSPKRVRRLDNYGRDIVEVLRKVPDKWLEWQYAVKPMMSDIHGAVTALDDHAYDQWKVTVKGKATFRATPGVDIFQTSSRNFSRVVGSTLHGCMVRIDMQPGNAALRKATELGLTNPINLAWERIPFSFVLDWAYPLGDYFRSLDGLLGWDVLGCSSSVFTKHKYEIVGRSGPVQGGTSTSQWNARYRYVSVNRTTSVVVPLPSFPSFKDPFSHSHVASGLSLLTGMLEKWGGRH